MKKIINTARSENCCNCHNDIQTCGMFVLEESDVEYLLPNHSFLCFKCANKYYERNTSPLTFWVAEGGLETSLRCVYSQFEYDNTPHEEFPSNLRWYNVIVEKLQDKNRWVLLKNQWLHCAWTPNQSSEEQLENHYQMEILQKEMAELEIVPKPEK